MMIVLEKSVVQSQQLGKRMLQSYRIFSAGSRLAGSNLKFQFVTLDYGEWLHSASCAAAFECFLTRLTCQSLSPYIIHARKMFANEILLNLEACEIDVVLRTFCSPTNRIFNWMATSISRLGVERMVANPRTAYAVRGMKEQNFQF